VAVDPSAPTRDRLVAATVECLRANGLDGLTSREITTRAGANLQAITYYFESKDALVAAALTELFERRLDPVRAALEADDPPVERLLAALSTIKAAFPAGRDDLKTYADAMAACSTNPALSRSLGELHDDLARYLSALIAEMQGEGFIAEWVDPDAMASLLIALGDGLTAQASFGEPNVVAVLDQLALLLVNSSTSAQPIDPR
jgi:AcrR family transcriptional regulator